MKTKQMFRAVAYETPKNDDLEKFGRKLANEAGVDDLALVKEDNRWVLKQGDRRLSAAYSKQEAVACVTGYIAGLRTAKSAAMSAA